MVKKVSWVIITKDDCPWCDKAKELLRTHGAYVSEFNINEPVTYRFVRANGYKTVPQIFMNGNRIGGYEDLVVMVKALIAQKEEP